MPGTKTSNESERSMLLSIRGVILMVLACLFGAVMLVGCGAMELPHVPEFGFNWISKDGKSQEQLSRDQSACRQDIMLRHPSDCSGPGSDGSWGMSDVKAFDECMYSKGWTKQ